MDELQQLKTRVADLENLLSLLIRSDRYTISKTMQFLDGRNIQLAKGSGTRIGTETTQKLSFYGVTPVVQQGAISDPSGGATVDSQARSAIISILGLLRTLGLIAS